MTVNRGSREVGDNEVTMILECCCNLIQDVALLGGDGNHAFPRLLSF